MFRTIISKIRKSYDIFTRVCVPIFLDSQHFFSRIHTPVAHIYNDSLVITIVFYLDSLCHLFPMHAATLMFRPSAPLTDGWLEKEKKPVKTIIKSIA